MAPGALEKKAEDAAPKKEKKEKDPSKEKKASSKDGGKDKDKAKSKGGDGKEPKKDKSEAKPDMPEKKDAGKTAEQDTGKTSEVTLKCAIMGGYKDKDGRLVACMVAAYSAEYDELQHIGDARLPVGDDQRMALTRRLEGHVVDGAHYNYAYNDAHVPDVWYGIGPGAEVQAAGLAISAVHYVAYAAVPAAKGVAVQSARLVHVHDVLRIADVITTKQVSEMYGKRASARSLP